MEVVDSIFLTAGLLILAYLAVYGTYRTGYVRGERKGYDRGFRNGLVFGKIEERMRNAEKDNSRAAGAVGAGVDSEICGTGDGTGGRPEVAEPTPGE